MAYPIAAMLLVGALVFAAMGVQWSVLFSASPLLIIIMMFLVFANLVVTGVLFSVATEPFEKPEAPITMLDMQALIASGTFLNYLPFKPGLVGRSVYLKRYHGIGYQESIHVFFTVLSISMLVYGVVIALSIHWPSMAWVKWVAILAIAMPIAGTISTRIKFKQKRRIAKSEQISKDEWSKLNAQERETVQRTLEILSDKRESTEGEVTDDDTVVIEEELDEETQAKNADGWHRVLVMSYIGVLGLLFWWPMAWWVRGLALLAVIGGGAYLIGKSWREMKLRHLTRRHRRYRPESESKEDPQDLRRVVLASLLTAISLRFLDLFLAALRLFAAFAIMGYEIQFGQATILVASGMVVSLFGVTPNGIGLREWAYAAVFAMGGFINTSIDSNVELLGIVLAAAVIDRAIEALIVIPVGLLGLNYLKQKNADETPFERVEDRPVM